jgi:hypothetical protein
MRQFQQPVVPEAQSLNSPWSGHVLEKSRFCRPSESLDFGLLVLARHENGAAQTGLVADKSPVLP